MSRSRMFAVACALVSVVACGDPLSPPVGSRVSLPSQPSVVSIRGVVELIDEEGFGLRRSETEVVRLMFEAEALMTVLGREVIAYGNWHQGAFAVSRLELAEDPGDELMRVPPRSKRPAPAAGRAF